MTVQYCHNRRDKHVLDATLAFALPTKNDLHTLFLAHGTQTIMSIGLTVKSETDRFEKKLGREAAFKKMAMGAVNLSAVEIHGVKHVYRFQTYLPHNRSTYRLKFSVSTFAESENVRLIYAYVERIHADLSY